MKSLLLIISLAAISCSNNKNINKTQLSITELMTQSAKDWNEGNLDAFMALYDTASTFMMPNGPVGIAGMKENYQKSFFNGRMPKQNLKFEEMLIRALGEDYVLLTGKFVLYGNDLPEKSGRYSLVFVQRKEGWKILHDHSS